MKYTKMKITFDVEIIHDGSITADNIEYIVDDAEYLADLIKEDTIKFTAKHGRTISEKDVGDDITLYDLEEE